MPFKPGNAGRPKGAVNHLTRDVREMISGALDDAGGRKYLAARAKDTPQAFLALLGKVVPKEIHAIVDVTVNLDYSLREPRE